MLLGPIPFDFSLFPANNTPLPLWTLPAGCCLISICMTLTASWDNPADLPSLNVQIDTPFTGVTTLGGIDPTQGGLPDNIDYLDPAQLDLGAGQSIQLQPLVPAPMSLVYNEATHLTPPTQGAGYIWANISLP